MKDKLGLAGKLFWQEVTIVTFLCLFLIHTYECCEILTGKTAEDVYSCLTLPLLLHLTLSLYFTQKKTPEKCFLNDKCEKELQLQVLLFPSLHSKKRDLAICPSLVLVLQKVLFPSCEMCIWWKPRVSVITRKDTVEIGTPAIWPTYFFFASVEVNSVWLKLVPLPRSKPQNFKFHPGAQLHKKKNKKYCFLQQNWVLENWTWQVLVGFLIPDYTSDLL